MTRLTGRCLSTQSTIPQHPAERAQVAAGEKNRRSFQRGRQVPGPLAPTGVVLYTSDDAPLRRKCVDVREGTDGSLTGSDRERQYFVAVVALIQDVGGVGVDVTGALSDVVSYRFSCP